MATFTVTTQGTEDIKRLYANGSIYVECPGCGASFDEDLSQNYISYGILSLWCGECEHWWDLTIVKTELTLSTE